jgi:hypothetical protein
MKYSLSNISLRPVKGEILSSGNKAMRVDRNANPIPSPGYLAKGGGALTQLFNSFFTPFELVITVQIKNLP